MEFVLINRDSTLWVALGSDHTDRKAETARYPLKPGWAMFGGTLAARGGIRPGKAFRMELEDPVRKRKLAHEYRIEALPVEG